MAIRTTGAGSALRIITKTVDGEARVSCSCCVECCMYPADQLGIEYDAADLPDELTIDWEGHYTGAVTKSGSGYAGGSITLQVVDGSWQLAHGSTTHSVGNCLIIGDGNHTPGDDLVEDTFQDAYTVTFENSTTLTLVRESLCNWISGGPIEYALYYKDTSAEWILRDSSFQEIPKTSGQFQDTPTGTYGSSGVLTVS